MKKIYVLMLALFSFTACDDYLDVGDDPNKSASAEPGPIFTQVLVGYSTNRVIDLGPPVSTAGQMWSGGGSLGVGVFTNPERYNFSIFTTGNTWRTYYRDIQKDLLLAVRNAEESGANNAIAQCEIFSALTYWSASVLWERVPQMEAVDVDFTIPEIINLNPVFDEQPDVLNSVITILDAALARIDETPNAITSNDLIYNGDMEQWRRFARSLRLRTLMTLVDAEPGRASEIGTMVDAGNMIGEGDDAMFPFFPEPGNRNPFWETLNSFAGQNNLFYFASEAMVDLMTSRNDPRLNVYFEPYPFGSESDVPVGAPAGVSNIGFTPWVLSTATPGTNGTVELVRPNSPDVLFSYQEQLFLEAEAIARGFASGGLAEANSRLQEGIRIAMESYNISSDDIDTYLAALPDLSTLSADEATDIIAEQQWIDNIVRPVEGWVTWRRHEVPALEVPDGASTTSLVRRLPYGPDELAANTNAPEDPPLDVRMYFDR